MYNKVRELCAALNILTMDELKENGIEAIMVFAIGSNFTGVGLSKGNFPEILSLIGSAVTNTAKASGFTVKEILEMIEENEALLEALQKAEEGD